MKTIMTKVILVGAIMLCCLTNNAQSNWGKTHIITLMDSNFKTIKEIHASENGTFGLREVHIVNDSQFICYFASDYKGAYVDGKLLQPDSPSNYVAALMNHELKIETTWKLDTFFSVFHTDSDKINDVIYTAANFNIYGTLQHNGWMWLSPTDSFLCRCNGHETGVYIAKQPYGDYIYNYRVWDTDASEAEAALKVLNPNRILFSWSTDWGLYTNILMAESRRAISISPNPVGDELYINSVNDAQLINVQIWDVTGKLINSAKPANNILSTANLAPGMYILYAAYSDGTFATQKFVK